MSDSKMNVDQLTQWIGNFQQSTDTIRADHARLLQATLNQDPNLVDGDVLPPLWHFTYFLEGKKQSQLGRDGHPAKGGFLPPVPLPRRMWAGGRIVFHAPILFGETITKTSTITNVVPKSGRSGDLCFVTVRHDLTDGTNTLRLSEEQDIVYREDPAPDAPAPKPMAAPQTSHHRETITPDPALLFRYSALTFNGHRIHYDVDYCRDVEGYPGLIFHGPLTATLLASLARRHAGKPLKSFDFRAVSPLFDTAPFDIAINQENDELTVWAETPEGNLAMQAKATV